MTIKKTLDSQALRYVLDDMYQYNLVLEGVDLCKFELVRQHHNQERLSNSHAALDREEFAKLLVKMHKERPLDVAINNEYEILSGFNFISPTKCAKGRK